MENGRIQATYSEAHITLESQGDWVIDNVAAIEQGLSQIKLHDATIVWDLAAIKHFDSAGVLLFIKYYERFKEQGHRLQVTGYSEKQKKLYTILHAHHRVEEPPAHPAQSSFFYRLGVSVIDVLTGMRRFFDFLGRVGYAFFLYLLYPKTIRLKEITYHIEQSFIKALPIIMLTSFLIGVVIAYQSSVQLAKFGADIFIVDMVGISISRELAPLITAIVIAGRSGSAYTAQIGVMKLTEEISAMQTMGFDPYRFLVLPRIIALMITLPLIIFFADIVGIAGGMFVANLELGISYAQFIARLQETLAIKHYLIGIIKGPFFAFLIAVIGTYRGFGVSHSTESIGRETTKSVVNGIFFVIACDALFSVLLTEIGL
jgi:phospholipid/cholesterol/gamma-HCH transport system permease protein